MGKTLGIDFGDSTLKHQEMTEGEQRFMRARWLVQNMDPESVLTAEKEGNLVPGTLTFIERTVSLLREIEEKRAVPDDLCQIVLSRLEDAYTWSMERTKLTDEQRKKVIEWCERDGWNELAENIRKVEKENCDG